MVTEDPGAAHLSINLTLALSLHPQTHTNRASDEEELTYPASAAEQREDPMMTWVDGGVLPYINPTHVKEIFKLH